MTRNAIRQSAIPRVSIAAASLAVAAMTGMPPAHAVDGTITITGEITDQTCKINGAEPPHNLLVTLPKIGTSAMKNVNDTAGATLFQIRLTDCPEALKAQTLTAYFEPGSTTDYATGNLVAYTTAAAATVAATIPSPPGATVFKNVQIQLANLDGTAIRVGADVTAQAAQGAVVSDKAATLRYLARYVRTSTEAITAGKLVSYVQYSIVYP
ncbi:fimbrial protein [Bordetella hinzii]|uniref:Fimbrial protein n=1 Tax=Bordetella hinzii OH87 BAL007II TaxID=1331262 RepID=A0ABR4QXA8_9BORD|nr:fimbrial protein [Bordetella hinzii]KCB22498.1 fimbrial protein [Bordetella hinzii OH87 BAL007II]KCB41881.1 fimbrial protein [Bordetella hinzii 5132]QDJ40745.1 fimbrial protein [Bordetella hinzii]QDJ54214.1 fimbrial protein [Bordetella hinzii]QWF40382.1 fimbrial protein [Bordetella hinzii]